MAGAGVIPIFAGEQADHDDERGISPQKRPDITSPIAAAPELDNGVSPTPEANLVVPGGAANGPQQLVDGDLAEAEVLLDAAAV